MTIPVQETVGLRLNGMYLKVQLAFSFHAVANLVAGDSNGDGVVNGLDIANISSNWGKTGSLTPGNVNGDGVVNGLDIAMVSSHWLQRSPTMPSYSLGPSADIVAPEPSTGVIFAVGTFGLWLGRRRIRRFFADVNSSHAAFTR